jgi:hypothetical protein
MPALFHESQPLGKWHGKLILAMPPAGVIVITCRQLFWRIPWGTPPTSDGGMIFLSVLALLLYIRLVTIRLVTDLDAQELVVRLKGFGRKRTIPLAQIRAVKPAQFDAIRDFGGYGFRSGARGRAYIARGNGAVELELQDGRKVFIGSQQAAQLAKQISAGKSGKSA